MADMTREEIEAPRVEDFYRYLRAIFGVDQERCWEWRGTCPGQSKTECSVGHAFTAENTAVRPNGTRYCRTCSRESNRKYRERNRDGRQHG